MSGTGPTRNPVDTGMPGGAGAGMPPGSAEVHSRVTQTGGASAGAASTSPGGTQQGNLADRGMERARGMAHEAEDQVREMGERASEAASQARQRAAQALDQAEDTIEQQTGLISTIRSNPLPALGIAFGLGFFLAGSGGGRGRKGKGRQRSGVMHRATSQAKTAILGAISAAAAEQVRELLGSFEPRRPAEPTRPRGTAGQGPARH